MSIQINICGIELINSRTGLGKRKINTIVRKICSSLNLLNGSINIIFCDNNTIRKINKEYRKKDKPTDVISFSYRETPFPAVNIDAEPLGDIYISLEKASENAPLFNNDLHDEIIRLLVHGLTHLAGYDHEKSEADDAEMKAKELQILHIL